jgi:hypothetical protein
MMRSEEITFTREEFYEKVWSMPATKLGAELGISDVMVGKICRSYDIPKPYLGYWAKLQHGKKPKRTPLPEVSEPSKKTVTISKHSPAAKSGARDGPTTLESISELEYDSDIQEMLERAVSLKPLTVPKTLSNPHPLVASTREVFRQHRSPTRRSSDSQLPSLPVFVSEGCEARALRIMEALIKRVEKIGGSVEVRKEGPDEYRTRTVVTFGGEDVAVLRLREKQKQVHVPPERRKYHWQAETELQPSGLLVLDTGEFLHNKIMLYDTPKRRRIEDGLNDLVIGFIRKAGRARNKRRRDEANRKRWEAEAEIRRQEEVELRRRQEELAGRQRAEQDRVDELVRHANSWKQSRAIREYMSAICDLFLERDGRIWLEGDAADYLRWAHQQADRLDPLRPSPASVLDLATPPAR